MKKIQKLCFLALVGLMVGTSCEKTPQAPDPSPTQAPNPNPKDECIEGVVIVEARGTNRIPSVVYGCETVVQIKNRNLGIQLGNLNNCVVIRNLDPSLAKFNQKIYFKTLTEETVQYDPMPWITADCIPVVWVTATDISTRCNP